MPASHIAILLPPSEGKAGGGSRPLWRPSSGEFGKALSKYRSEISESLLACGGGDSKLLGVSGRNLEDAQKANSSLGRAPTLTAVRRYTGVVWDHARFDELSPTARVRASNSVYVMSGLLGLVALDDPIPNYKLKMGGSLPGIGKLSSFWREPLSQVLNARLEGIHVIDLLPIEHRSAWLPTPSAYASLSSVNFVEKSGKVAGHDAKAAKGDLVHHLLESKTSVGKALSTWKNPRFNIEW